MSKTKEAKSKTPAKEAVISRLCEALDTTNYAELEDRVRNILAIANRPICAVTVVWKPEVAGSVNFTGLGFDANDPEALHVASQACTLVAQDLSTRAIKTAIDTKRVEPAPIRNSEEFNGREDIGE